MITSIIMIIMICITLYPNTSRLVRQFILFLSFCSFPFPSVHLLRVFKCMGMLKDFDWTSLVLIDFEWFSRDFDEFCQILVILGTERLKRVKRPNRAKWMKLAQGDRLSLGALWRYMFFLLFVDPANLPSKFLTRLPGVCSGGGQVILQRLWTVWLVTRSVWRGEDETQDLRLLVHTL